MANIVEELMNFDPSEIDEPTKDFTMKLKKLGDKEMTFPLKALNTEQVCTIQDGVFRIDIGAKKGSDNTSGDVRMALYQAKVKTITLGCPDVFQNPQLLNHFGVKTGAELINALLTSGEVDELKNQIDELSGFETEEDLPTDLSVTDEVKN